jgi:Uma2 family endonuclease
MAQGEYPNITIDDYLTLDQNSQNARYEYLEGELRMLAGGSANHSIITTNLTGMVYGLLKDRPCLVLNNDMKLQLSESRYVYPDITMTCDPRDQAPEDEMTHFPSVVVEVLSPSTVSVDRGKKLLYYQAHQTIQAYLLVDSQSILIEAYQREKGRWTFSTYGLEGELEVVCLGIRFSVSDVYKKTSLIKNY